MSVRGEEESSEELREELRKNAYRAASHAFPNRCLIIASA